MLGAVIDVGIDICDEHGKAAIHWASCNGHVGVIQKLLENQADINVKSGLEGKAPIHMAAGAGQLEVIPVLLAAGADASAQDETGVSPIHYAAGLTTNSNLNVTEQKMLNPLVTPFLNII